MLFLLPFPIKMRFFAKKLLKNLERKEKWYTFAPDLRTAPRGGAVVARWAHNPKAGGSIPSPATFKENIRSPFFISNNIDINSWLTPNSGGGIN